jgi:hypothetical protein
MSAIPMNITITQNHSIKCSSRQRSVAAVRSFSYPIQLQYVWHTTWTCLDCGGVVYGPPPTDGCQILVGSAAVR